MAQSNYAGYERVLKDSLVAARGKKELSQTELKILALEKKLETAKLTNTEIADIRKQLRQLR